MSTETKILVALAAVVTVGMTLLLVFAGGDSASEKPPADAGKLVRSDSIQTAPDAKVTVVEFGDLQCPACAAANTQVGALKKEFKGKVNFVWRHFPLAMHANAVSAANASEAANKQGKFFEYADRLFERQNEWSASSGGSLFVHFERYATALKLDPIPIKEAAEKQSFKAKIDKDAADGAALGVNSTPTFYLDGKQVEVGELRAAIRKALGS